MDPYRIVSGCSTVFSECRHWVTGLAAIFCRILIVSGNKMKLVSNWSTSHYQLDWLYVRSLSLQIINNDCLVPKWGLYDPVRERNIARASQYFRKSCLNRFWLGKRLLDHEIEEVFNSTQLKLQNALWTGGNSLLSSYFVKICADSLSLCGSLRKTAKTKNCHEPTCFLENWTWFPSFPFFIFPGFPSSLDSWIFYNRAPLLRAICYSLSSCSQ